VSSAGLSRKVARKRHTHTRPTSPSITKAPRQPNGYASTMMTSGAAAPPQRADIQTSPCAKPRSRKGNQFLLARAMLG
jgi:hypothetical protein